MMREFCISDLGGSWHPLNCSPPISFGASLQAGYRKSILKRKSLLHFLLWISDPLQAHKHWSVSVFGIVHEAISHQSWITSLTHWWLTGWCPAQNKILQSLHSFCTVENVNFFSTSGATLLFDGEFWNLGYYPTEPNGICLHAIMQLDIEHPVILELNASHRSNREQQILPRHLQHFKKRG